MSEQLTIDQAAIGYVRVSTDDQAANGHGLAAQRAAIQLDAARRGWTIEYVEGSRHHPREMAQCSGRRHQGQGSVG
jgi:hypothetical protein